MESTGWFLVLAGVIFGVYSITFRSRVNIYNRGKGFEIIDKDKFLDLQFKIALMNSALMITFGSIILILNLPNVYAITYMLVFHTINSLTIFLGKKMQFIEYR